MFKKIVIANRGEIAVRIIRTCQDMGIATVALYEAPDRDSLHVRLADEAVLLDTPEGFMDGDAIIQLALEKGADAIHPGYGYLAEETHFIRGCDAAGIAFVGPSADVVEVVHDKLNALERAREAGYRTVEHSQYAFDEDEFDQLSAEADRLGYPVVIKSCSGGRGRGERFVWQKDALAEAFRRARQEAQIIYGSSGVYLEKAILPAHQVTVQILADQHGSIVHLGEREGSLIVGNQKVIEESPAPCLSPDQRAALWQAALDIAGLFDYRSVGSIEFLVDADGQFYFTEFKSRLQVDHPISEIITRVDLVREQIRIAAGEPLSIKQEDVHLHGSAMMCRISAADPLRRFLPSPGTLRLVRLPGGPEVRVDTYVYSGSTVPAEYDPLIAKLTVWGETREQCHTRLRRSLEEIAIVGTQTNVPLLQQIVNTPTFADGCYTTDFLHQPLETQEQPETYFRDLAVAAAILYASRNQSFRPAVPKRLSSGWHRDSRRLPQ